MDYSFFLWSTASYIESRLQEQIHYSELESIIGFSYRHIRETFRECTGITLSRYIKMRRIANAAYEIVNTSKSLTTISSDYMFECYYTFDRTFMKYTGHLPSDFRNKNIQEEVIIQRILVGMYGPVIINNNASFYLRKQNWSSTNSLINCLTNKDVTKHIDKSKEDCILYGVPKVSYSSEGITPFCVSLKSCLNYIGQQIDYAYLMIASGAAFRLRWNTNSWDADNVAISNIYEDYYEVYHRTFMAVGRNYKILRREASNKQKFVQFIKAEIDAGRPVIAIGIIGPPEACLITGYKNNGNILLGWNCFQENQEYKKNVSINETGYFVTDAWWENEYTIAVMSIGEYHNYQVNDKLLLINACRILKQTSIIHYDKKGNVVNEYACGQRAYELWAKSVSNDKEFPPNAILPILYERIICQCDAQDMVHEGRSFAAWFLNKIGQDNSVLRKKCRQAAMFFQKAAECSLQMNECKGGILQDERIARKFSEPETRTKIVLLILQAKEYERKASKLLEEIILDM